jgi:hypothetical protein
MMYQRMAQLFLGAAFLAAFAPLGVRPAAGFGAAATVALASLALAAAGLWLIGAQSARAIAARPTFLPGALLAASPIALLALAATAGVPTAALPADFLLNTTGLLLGAALLFVGFALLAVRLWESGERVLSALGMAALLVGTTLWVANLVARYAVVASGAAPLHAAAEADYWLASSYLLGVSGEPSWLAFLLVWLDMLQLAYLLLTYLSAAAFWLAVVRAGWAAQTGGRFAALLALLLALAIPAGALLAAVGVRPAAMLVFVVTIPFMSTILPCFLGLALLRRGAAAIPERHHHPIAEPAGAR